MDKIDSRLMDEVYGEEWPAVIEAVCEVTMATPPYVRAGLERVIITAQRGRLTALDACCVFGALAEHGFGADYGERSHTPDGQSTLQYTAEEAERRGGSTTGTILNYLYQKTEGITVWSKPVAWQTGRKGLQHRARVMEALGFKEYVSGLHSAVLCLVEADFDKLARKVTAWMETERARTVGDNLKPSGT